MHSNKWTQTGRHFFRNLKGFPQFLFAHPLFAPKLLKARAGYFFTRQLPRPVATPEGFVIETTEELVSYWSFFVERECLTSEWVNALLAETKPVVVDVGANAGLFSHLDLDIEARCPVHPLRAVVRDGRKDCSMGGGHRRRVHLAQ